MHNLEPDGHIAEFFHYKMHFLTQFQLLKSTG